MSSSEFENLLNLIGPKINKMDTNYGKAIPVNERLAITLLLCIRRFLSSLMYIFKIFEQIISRIIIEV